LKVNRRFGEHVASIFGVEAKKETRMKQVESTNVSEKQVAILRVEEYFTMKTEETHFSETSADFQRTTWRYIPEDGTRLIYIEMA
jgi:hypothetical protein